MIFFNGFLMTAYTTAEAVFSLTVGTAGAAFGGAVW